MKLLEGIVGDAEPKGDSPRRHWLTRRWSAGPMALVIGINPSKATELRDDQTTRFLTELLRGLNGMYQCGGYALVNCSDIRASKPKLLNDHPAPFSPANFELIKQKLADCDFVVASWGTTFYGAALEDARRQVSEAVRASGKPIICFSPRGLPIHCRRTNKNSKDGRWSDIPVLCNCDTVQIAETLQATASLTPRRRRRPPLITSIASDRSQRVRPKQQIVKDVAFILNVPEAWLSYAAQHAVLRQAAWTWTEINGKYEGCEIWSKAAWKIRHVAEKGELIHEHAVPRAIVIGMLRQLAERHRGKVTTPMVRRILGNFLHGVVITREEDQRLSKAGWRGKMPREFGDPDSGSYMNPFLRYQRCGISLREASE